VCDGLKTRAARLCADCYQIDIAKHGRPRRYGKGNRSVMVVETWFGPQKV
jgi:hypothetical protein